MPDALTRFLFEALPVRGALVHLGSCWQEVLRRRAYEPPSRAMLGEALAATALLASGVKQLDQLQLQLQDQGGTGLLVTQLQGDGGLRGMVETASLAGPTAESLLGRGGNLLITLTPRNGDQYQGIVPLAGQSLTHALQHYFDRSEQLPTRLLLGCDAQCCTGILLQRLPGETADSDAWNRLEHLLATVRHDELATLDAAYLLQRVFPEDDLRLFEPNPLYFRCGCSRERIGSILRALDAEELQQLLQERGQVDVDCRFCGCQYTFDAVDVTQLLQSIADTPDPGKTTH